MRIPLVRLVASLVALFIAAPSASAQIQWNVTYQDVVNNSGAGFDSDEIFSGSLTHGQLRRDSVDAALTYLGTVLDGRGTVNLRFNPSLSSGTGSLASFGPQQYVTVGGTSLPGSFQNGGAYQAARTNARIFGDTPDAAGQFNFGYGWNYAGQTPNGGNYDMVTVAIHEIGHGIGFLSLLEQNGSGLSNQPVGTPDLYSGLDKYLQRGNGPAGSLFNTNIADPNYASFTGPVSTLTNGNDPSTGLFFGGQYAREVYGGAVPMYAPGGWNDGSSVSHVNDGNAVMNPNITPNTVKRFQRYEIAMLMDAGWNVYNWDNGGGNWKDGVNANGSFTLANSNWRSDSGIVYSTNTPYNLQSHPNPAPVLAPYGQVTSNIVLNFGGGGSSTYTSTNDLGAIRLARLNLDSTSSQTNTITGGTLIFGVNQDDTSSVLTPKIVQKNSGAFAVNSDLVVANTTGAAGGGWTGLTVDGAGGGQVSLGGVISGNGTLTKAGAFTLQLSGASANTYSGLTTVQAGTLLLNKTPGQNAMAGSLTVNSGGTVRLGAADQLPGTGTVTLAGGTLSTGATTGFSDVVGAFEMTSASAIALGTGTHTLQFTGFNDSTLAGPLTITGWTGSLFSTGTSGRILVSGVSGDPNSLYSSWLSTVQFQGFGQGGLFITTETAQTFELVPVPEPATVLGVAFGALGFATLLRRRFRLLREPTSPHPTISCAA